MPGRQPRHGFLGRPGIRIYRIADLYRPALGLNPKWEERSSSRSLTTGG
ncbi:hypothetical protein ABZ816_08040 [Actinosynnema sp. NPDC047251]|uniref:Uncharacterized protein n=1 Tax=Saccharothrix espanaensis (strain ATCC 51144 / DSM 44229 / JCM 9112 / NBRC 15066 / NRRL 15764) TaxID=1179773 RepID=K0JNQ4_SACES|nr:hypothetical protein [Saccharothrix espanaensis]CCH27590.1 hypothetical protein BN6_02570 [Saccharothrix espanaensis DSM 44229]